MSDPIRQAIEHADRPENGGGGYTLLIRLVSGRHVEVVASYADAKLVLRRWRGGDDPHGDQVFFNPANVEQVEILW